MEAYYAEFDTYTTDLAKAGFATKGAARYAYSSAGTANFTATASGTIGSATDTWTMTDQATLTNTANACS